MSIVTSIVNLVDQRRSTLLRFLHPLSSSSVDNTLRTTTRLNRDLQMQVSNISKSASLIYTIIKKQYQFMTCSDWFPVPVRSAVKSNLTNCCCQNLFKCALNALTVQASTTELGTLFQIFTRRNF